MNNYNQISMYFKFTLLELLIVISIILILSALLLPAIGLARQNALAIKCSGNLKGTGVLLSFYRNDYDDWFWASGAHPTWGQKLWDTGYIKDFSTLRCTYPHTVPTYNTSNSAGQEQIYGASYNASSGDGFHMKSRGMNTYQTGTVSEKTITPSLVLLAGCSRQTAQNNTRDQFALMLMTAATHTINGSLYMIHQNKANATMLDGHVGILSLNKLITRPYYFPNYSPSYGGFTLSIIKNVVFPNVYTRTTF